MTSNKLGSKMCAINHATVVIGSGVLEYRDHGDTSYHRDGVTRMCIL